MPLFIKNKFFFLARPGEESIATSNPWNFSLFSKVLAASIAMIAEISRRRCGDMHRFSEESSRASMARAASALIVYSGFSGLIGTKESDLGCRFVCLHVGLLHAHRYLFHRLVSRLSAIASDRRGLQEPAEARLAGTYRSSERRRTGHLGDHGGTGKSKTCVWRWQERFMHEGVNGLLRDRSRPPGKAPIAPDHVAGIVRLALKPPPLEATHWTLRAMVKTAGVAASTVPGGLEGARPQPTPLATLQALERPGFCREAHGYRRPLC